MQKLRLKYIETENNDKDMGSIARMVVKRKCDLAKVINKRAQNTHKQKVLIKRTPDEVKWNPIKGTKKAFVFGKHGWFTKDGCGVSENSSNEERSADYY